MKTFSFLLIIVLSSLSTVNLRAQLESCNGPFGAHIHSLAVNGSNIFAGTEGAGVFLSTNNGASWSAINNGFTASTVFGLAFNGSSVFAATNSGVFLSINNGTNWTEVNNGLGNHNTRDIIVNSGIIFVATNGNGVYKSTNNGSNWNAINSGLGNLNIQCLLYHNGNLFAGTSGGGLYKSTNNGTNWTLLGNGINSTTWVLSLIGDGNNIYAGTSGEGIYKSTDNGTTWIQSWAISGPLCFAINGSNIYAGTGVGIYLTTNSGSSWTQINNGLDATHVYALTVGSGYILAGTYYGYGVYKSTNNGSNWTESNNGLNALSINSFLSVGTNIYAGTVIGIFKSTNNGTNWSKVNTGLNSVIVRPLALNGSTIYSGTYDGGIFYSSNNGTTWNSANSGLTDLRVNAICVKGTNIFAGTGSGGVFFSSNNGVSWSAVNNGLSSLTIITLNLKGSIIFAGTNNGVFKSTNDGSSWTSVSTGLSNSYIFSLTSSSNAIYAGTSGGGINISTNDGASWATVNSGLDDLTVYSLLIEGNYIFAGTGESGVYVSSLNNINWVEIDGLENNINTEIMSLSVSNSNFYVGTNSMSAYNSPLQDIIELINSITTGTISPLSLCQKVTVDVPFTASGNFNTGNIFTAQLSNAAGSFASPTTIGTLTGTTSGTIIGTIPAGTTPGTGYRIRVISSDPAVDGSDNGSNITINPLPTPAITGSTTVCEDGKYFYSTSAPGITTSEWFVTNGKFEGESTGNYVEVEWKDAGSGTITLIQTTSAGCVDSTSLVVTINPTPHGVITTSDTILCVGVTGLYQSNIVAGVLYQWIVIGGTIIGAADSPALNVQWDNPVSGLVRLFQTYPGTECSDTTEVVVVVSPKPQPQITTSDTVLCINSTGLYTSNTDATAVYQWIATGGIIQGASNNSGVTVLWNSIGTNKIKLIQTYPATGCKDSTEKPLSVNPLPVTQITGNANVLLNSTEQYSANTPSGITNLWSVNNGTIIGSTTDAVLSVKWENVGTGIVMLEQTNTNTSCKNYDTLIISITSTIPPLTVNAGTDKSICEGASVQIGNANAASGGVQPYRYKWTPSQGLSNDTIPNPIANPLQSTAYNLTVFDSRDSIATDNMTVTVNPLPVPQISGNTSVLLNSEEIYSANTPAGTTNTWSVTNGTQIGNNSGNTFNVKWDLLGQGSVHLEQIITATGCKDENSIDVNVTTSIPGLSVDAGPNKEICMYDTVQIGSTNPASGGSPPYRYLWTPSIGLSNDTIPNPMASPLQSIVYSLTVYDSKDSIAADSVTLTVNPFPEALVRGNRNVQLNSIVTYSVDSPPGIANEWFVENGTQIGPNNDSTFKVQWNNLGNGRVISYQIITSTGCNESDTIDITITTSIPELIADAGSDKSVCLGDTVQIGTINAASGGVEPYKYKWSPSIGLNNDTIPNPKANPVTTTIYKLTITDSQDSIATDNTNVIINQLPTPKISGNNQTMRGSIVTYSVNVQAGTSNEWSVENGTQIGSGKGSTFQVRWDSAGTGKIIVEQSVTATGCHASDTLRVTIDAQQFAAILDIPDMSAEPGGEIYLPIYLRDAELLANTNVTGLIADLKFNASLLEPIETTPIGSLSGDGKERIIPLRLGVTPRLDSTLEYLSFMATLGNDSITVFTLENISTIGANVNIGSLTGTFTLKGICREGGARLVGSGPEASIIINPNPVNSDCKIEYQTYKGYAKLYIINSFGETVKTLFDGEISAGWHTTDYDLTNVPSGLYLVILQNETKRKAVRMDLVK